MSRSFELVAGDRSPLGRARLALEGLSIGDAFGERFFGEPDVVAGRIEVRALPVSPWRWTDDTAMALSVYESLREDGGIDRTPLARRFAARYRDDPRRGYGGAAHGILTSIAQGVPWEEAARAVFEGQGSMGNGAAMRSAPVGGYFADDLQAVVRHARASAEPTHAHPDAQARAIAVAVAAALAWQVGGAASDTAGEVLLRAVIARTPAGATRDGLERAASLPFGCAPTQAAAVLGSGGRVISSDTVPFALWCAARHLDDFEEALWATVSGLGDRDTTCAIVGGTVALAVGRDRLPRSFVEAREPLGLSLSGR